MESNRPNQLPFFTVDQFIDMAYRLDIEGLKMLSVEIADDSELYNSEEWGTIVYFLEHRAQELLIMRK